MISDFKKYALIAVFILFSATLITESGICYPGRDLLSEPITLQVKNRPLSEVLKKIADSCGYKIAIGDKWAQLPISISIVNTPVEQALKRILKNQNVVILTDNDTKQISLWLQGDMAAETKTNKTCDPALQESPMEFNKYIAQTGEENIELLPPTIADGKGITIRQIEQQQQAYLKTIKTQEIGVLPPSASMKTGMNLDQYNKSKGSAIIDQLDIHTISALPPDADGKSISLADLQSLPAPPPPPTNLPQ